MTKQLCNSSVIANNAQKTQKLFVQGYNLEVHKHHVTVWTLSTMTSKSKNGGYSGGGGVCAESY